MEATRAAAEAARLLAAGDALRGMPVQRRARVLAAVAAFWARADLPARRRVVPEIEAATGFSRPVIEAGLDRLFGAVREEALLEWWERHARPGGADRRPRLAAVVAAGNIPGVPLFPAVGCLLAAVPALVKVPSAEPFLLPAWVETLKEVDPVLGHACAAVAWVGGEEEVEAAAFRDADRILVLGSDATVRRIEARWPRRVAGYGTGISLAVVGEGADDEAARALALDVAVWDQQGCLSPQGAHVLGGGFDRAAAFAGRVAEAMAGIQRALPRGRLTAGEAARIRETRADAEARSIAGEEVRLWTPGAGLDWTVTAEADPTFHLSCLNRTIWVRPLRAPEDLAARLAPWRSRLQGAGVAVPESWRPRVEEALRRAGVPHVVPLGTLQAPAVDWPNKGRDLLEDLHGPSLS